MKVNGEVIKDLRESAGLKHSHLAAAADMSDRWVQLVEKGKLVNININIARAICKELGCKLIDIRKG